MFQGRNSQKAGIFHDHLMVFHHVEESDNQLGILDCDDFVHILLYVWEQQFSRGLHCSAVRYCVN